MTTPLTIECDLRVSRRGRGAGKTLELRTNVGGQPGRVPRVAKLMALAIRLEKLVQTGTVANFAEVARHGHVTRARVSQIMNLLHLAPDIQEALLFLPRITAGRDPLTLRDLQPIALTPNWTRQRAMWRDRTAG